MKKNILLYSFMITLLIIVTACDNATEEKSIEPAVADETPAWETKVITPLRVVEYFPEGLAALSTYSYNDPQKALGLPSGGGESAGSVDVTSLGFDETGEGGYIILEFDKKIINGVGVDFKIFENTIKSGENSYFLEVAKVYLSEDALTWREFPASFSGDSANAVDIASPNNYTGYAGLMPVFSNWKNASSPKPEDANSGGDFFDLENMTSPIKENGFKFIKIVDAGVLVNDPGNAKDANGDYIFKTSGFDLDAVVGINYE